MEESRPDSCTFASLTVPSRVESVRVAAAFLMQAAKDARVRLASDALFEVALVEALNNAVKHGNPANREDAVIVIEVELADQHLTVRILDQGTGFALPTRPQPEWTPDDVASIRESGYGISIIQHVFPIVRTIWRADQFGLELSLRV